jgi:hypothetical protein
MDKLICREIRIEDIPEDEPSRFQGRIGELFARLLALKPGMALAVECRDVSHARSTLRHTRAKARKASLAIKGKRVGTTCYVQRG